MLVRWLDVNACVMVVLVYCGGSGGLGVFVCSGLLRFVWGFCAWLVGCDGCFLVLRLALVCLCYLLLGCWCCMVIVLLRLVWVFIFADVVGFGVCWICLLNYLGVLFVVMDVGSDLRVSCLGMFVLLVMAVGGRFVLVACLLLVGLVALGLLVWCVWFSAWMVCLGLVWLLVWCGFLVCLFYFDCVALSGVVVVLFNIVTWLVFGYVYCLLMLIVCGLIGCLF